MEEERSKPTLQPATRGQIFNHTCASLSLAVAGQTAGGDVEAAGQPGRPRRHGSGDAEGRRGGRRSVGRELEGQQPAAGEASSPGGRVDRSAHDLTPSTAPPSAPLHVTSCRL